MMPAVSLASSDIRRIQVGTSDGTAGLVTSFLYRALAETVADPGRLAWLSIDSRSAPAERAAPIGLLDAARAVATASARGIPVEFLPVSAPRPEQASVIDPAIGRQGEGLIRGLLRLRRELGLGLFDKSPIFWNVGAYRLSEWLLGADQKRPFDQVAQLVPSGASVTDLCCGPADLFTRHLARKGCSYIGLDFNGRFRQDMRRRGVDYRFIQLPDDRIPASDVVVMCSSFYHFRECEDQLLERMRAAAKRKVIIAEPTSNLSNHRFRPLGRLANRLTAPGVGSHDFRHDSATFRQFAERNGARELIGGPETHHAIAVFEGSR